MSVVQSRNYQDTDAVVLQQFGRVRRLTDTNHIKHLVLLQLLWNNNKNTDKSQHWLVTNTHQYSQRPQLFELQVTQHVVKS